MRWAMRPERARKADSSYGAAAVVDHADLTVQTGAVDGFLGPMGEDKTTMLRMLLALVRPDVGSIRPFVLYGPL